MKTICIDARMAFHAGIGTYIRNIIDRLARASFKLQLIVAPDFLPKWPLLNQLDLIVTTVPLFSIAEQLKLPILIPKCDLFWSPHYNIPIPYIRAKNRLTTIHDVYHLAFNKTLTLPKKIYSKLVINAATRLSEHIITDSEFSRDEIIKYTKADHDKISVIHLGVESHHFTPQINPKALQEVQAKYQLPEKYFIFVSTLLPHKNIHRLLKAWKILNRELTDWKLIIVGKPTYDKSWQKMVDEDSYLKGSVSFLGQVPFQHLPALYRLASGAIHPSLYEGFGLTPLEAMSSGCPTVVSKAASLPEVCGDSSMYVDPYDVDDIASGMRKLACDSNLRQELKAKGLSRSREFTWDKTVDKHIEILDRLA